LCLLREKGSIFAKNSDRPVSELQLVRSYPARNAGGALYTQYLTIEDTGAIPCVLSRPTWLWGAEHGVNAFHVAIGNEKIYATSDPYDAQPALIGMDLVRLGLERGRSAEEAIDVMTALLERHGQGGVADATTNEPYWSSFLVVDPTGAWVLETCARTWAARWNRDLQPDHDPQRLGSCVVRRGKRVGLRRLAPTRRADRSRRQTS
jgi:secernin